MNSDKLQQRNSALDIIRIVAVFSVVSVHFLLNNGFYSQTVEGVPMYFGCLIRTLFSVCVPLFMILTGYLMCHKTLSKSYYSGIVKTLVIFAIATVICMAYKTIAFGDEFSLKALILGLLDFTGAKYSWYIEMYIGLFLLAPFLNLIYNNLKTLKGKQILVGTMVVLTIIPSVFNIFNFESLSWWASPGTSTEYSDLFPNWWIMSYPITYYFVGCYLRENKLKVKTRTLIILFVLAVVLFTSFNYYRCYGFLFKTSSYVNWYGFEPFILSVFLFIILSRIKTENYPDKVKICLWKVADLALGAYLISYIFDQMLYPILKTNVPNMPDRIPFYFVMVPSVFILSMLASAVMNFMAKYFIIGFQSLVAFIKKQRESEKRGRWQHVAFATLMAAFFGISLWKCFYGFGGNDEAFYLTIPQRLLQGDAFISDEWHLSQLSGFLTMPFVWLYTTIAGSTEGIMLAARIAYLLLHTAVVVIIYVRLRKHGYIAMLGCTLYYLFTPFDIMAMSYNTMGLDLVILTGVIMGTASYKKIIPLIISGVTFAAAVLCCPYLVFAYALYICAVAVHYILKKTKFNKNVFTTDLFSIKTFLFFTVGVAVLAAVFLAFALSRVSISEVMTNLPYLMTDPEHPSTGFFAKISAYFTSIWNCHDWFKCAIIAYAVMLAVMIIDKKRKLHRSVYLIVTTAIVIFSFVLFVPKLNTVYYNAIMYPMIFIGITSYILIDEKPRTLFASVFALGIIYSFALCFSSNQYFYIISMATAASNVASLVFLGKLVKEIRASEESLDYPKLCKYTSIVLVVFMLFLQTAFQIGIKTTHCFWDAAPSTLSTTISDGPAKGLITTASNASTYESIYNDLKYYDDKEKGNILCLTEKTWTYLALDDYSYGTLSAWLSGENQTALDRLETYYSLNPDKTPKYIYIPKDSSWDFSTIYETAAEKGYSVEENTVSYKLEKTE